VTSEAGARWPNSKSSNFQPNVLFPRNHLYHVWDWWVWLGKSSGKFI
jgi:hypothetical protein